MKAPNLVTVSELCIYHNVHPDFLMSVQKAGLIKIKVEYDIKFIPASEIKKLERVINLYRLDINIAGIEAISHLLDRMEQMQEHVRWLHNRLRIYEEE